MGKVRAATISQRFGFQVRPVDGIDARTEVELAAQILERLSEHFWVNTEVQGTHYSGRRLRIDAILRPINAELWKTTDPAIGLEFKLLRGIGGAKSFTKWCAQCADYAATDWDGVGMVSVFGYNIYMSTIGDSMVEPSTHCFYITRLMSRFGVGELREVKRRGLSFVMSGHHVMWSEIRGVETWKHTYTERRFGAR
jgi:hypothetical protein